MVQNFSYFDFNCRAKTTSNARPFLSQTFVRPIQTASEGADRRLSCDLGRPFAGDRPPAGGYRRYPPRSAATHYARSPAIWGARYDQASTHVSPAGEHVAQPSPKGAYESIFPGPKALFQWFYSGSNKNPSGI